MYTQCLPYTRCLLFVAYLLYNYMYVLQLLKEYFINNLHLSILRELNIALLTITLHKNGEG